MWAVSTTLPADTATIVRRDSSGTPPNVSMTGELAKVGNSDQGICECSPLSSLFSTKTLVLVCHSDLYSVYVHITTSVNTTRE